MPNNYESKEWKEQIKYYTENFIKVHLGIADRFLINKFYPKYEQKRKIDFFRSLRDFLSEFGYEGKGIRKFKK